MLLETNAARVEDSLTQLTRFHLVGSWLLVLLSSFCSLWHHHHRSLVWLLYLHVSVFLLFLSFPPGKRGAGGIWELTTRCSPEGGHMLGWFDLILDKISNIRMNLWWTFVLFFFPTNCLTLSLKCPAANLQLITQHLHWEKTTFKDVIRTFQKDFKILKPTRVCWKCLQHTGLPAFHSRHEKYTINTQEQRSHASLNVIRYSYGRTI